MLAQQTQMSSKSPNIIVSDHFCVQATFVLLLHLPQCNNIAQSIFLPPLFHYQAEAACFSFLQVPPQQTISVWGHYQDGLHAAIDTPLIPPLILL